MKNKSNTTNRNHAVIRTKQVFIEDDQVLLKEEMQESLFEDTNVPEWFPTDFQWIPARL